jgi:hypothetical protein
MRRAGVVVVAVVTLAAGARGEASMTALERQRLLAHLEVTSAWLIDEVSGLTDAQLAFKPSADAWSIAEVLDHLLVVAPIYWDDLQQALKTPPGNLVPRDTDADILWYGIDRTQREKAIATEIPRGKARDLRRALAEYRTHHERLRRYVATTSDELRRHLVARQGSDAYQWILLISTHEQRHILQIREIKASKAFPQGR